MYRHLFVKSRLLWFDIDTTKGDNQRQFEPISFELNHLSLSQPQFRFNSSLSKCLNLSIDFFSKQILDKALLCFHWTHGNLVWAFLFLKKYIYLKLNQHLFLVPVFVQIQISIFISFPSNNKYNDFIKFMSEKFYFLLSNYIAVFWRKFYGYY